MRIRTGLIAGAGLVAAVAMAASAATLADLGKAVGWHRYLAWSLPVSVDALALVAGVAWLAAGVTAKARTLGRTLTLLSVVTSVTLNALGHLVGTRHLGVGPEMVIAVSAVPPLAAALAVHLTAAITGTDEEAQEAPAEAQVNTTAPQVDTAPTLAPQPAPAVAMTREETAHTPSLPPRTEERTTDQEAALDTTTTPEVDTPATEVNTRVDSEVFTPEPEVNSRESEDGSEEDRLSAEEAKKRIKAAWADGLSVTEAAEASTRSRSYVHKIYAQMDAMQETFKKAAIEATPGYGQVAPVPGQMELASA